MNYSYGNVRGTKLKISFDNYTWANESYHRLRFLVFRSVQNSHLRLHSWLRLRINVCETRRYLDHLLAFYLLHGSLYDFWLLRFFNWKRQLSLDFRDGSSIAGISTDRQLSMNTGTLSRSHPPGGIDPLATRLNTANSFDGLETHSMRPSCHLENFTLSDGVTSSIESPRQVLQVKKLTNMFKLGSHWDICAEKSACSTKKIK